MYRWNAREYKKNSSNQKRWGVQLLSKIRLKGAERVLDIGCGDGRLTSRIAQKVPRGSVLGIDSSKAMIGLARTTFRNKTPNLSFRLQDAHRLDSLGKFDLVFSNAALHWIPDHRPLVPQIAKALRPGGRLIVQMGGKGNIRQVLDVTEEIMGKKKWRPYFRKFSFPFGFYDTREYRKMLEAAGLKVRRIRLLTKYMVYPGRREFHASLATLWMPYMQRLPERLRKEFLAETVGRFLTKFRPAKTGTSSPRERAGGMRLRPSSFGTVRVKMKRLEIEAVKRCGH